MHRRMRDDLEKLLAGESGNSAGHPAECAECREDLAAMKEQADWLRELRSPQPGSPSAVDGPRTGFYARVMERIEAQSPSIWNLFFDSQLGRRLAIASMAIALCLGVYLVSSESAPEQTYAPVPEVRVGAQPASMLVGMPDENSVLVNLITYREQ